MSSLRPVDPLVPFVVEAGVLILDGGLATELEKAGFDLTNHLWSARLLKDAPEAILAVHRAYLEAGADCITAASYQASLPGFERVGLDERAAQALLRRSVELALQARDAFWSDPKNRVGRLRPLVAASVGPYGAFLANGAEYTGDYDLDEGGLVRFHRGRLRILEEAGADLLACETLPSAAEARALVSLLEERENTGAWLSFSCRDGERISDGTPFVEVVREIRGSRAVLAVGVNCTAPQHVEGLLRAAAGVTTKPLVAYPNSGEQYDARTKTWLGPSSGGDWAERGKAWHRAGARLIGGCCRTGPQHVNGLREALLGSGTRQGLELRPDGVGSGEP